MAESATVAPPITSRIGGLVPAGQLIPFVLVTVLFYLWGIPNNLNDVLIRQFMKSFAINRLQAGLVQSAFYLGYFLLAMPAALLMRKLGYKAGFVIGLSLFGSGDILVLACGSHSRRVWILPVCSFCDRQRAVLSGDRFEPFHRATGGPGELGKSASIFRRLSIRWGRSAAS